MAKNCVSRSVEEYDRKRDVNKRAAASSSAAAASSSSNSDPERASSADSAAAGEGAGAPGKSNLNCH